ncbi:rho GTPase-activating protein 19 isoform X2 [Eurytemora carolleeae]|uniref:rho GTPase-activating protein 19 isoform X2 n=1 Tax=Eurytemora carolleeae TaxID=1294199 RepID=UPI000C78896A|nr:rho GTPase-activating protein 19 isoform X2 [Eurytemora carolleeae]XP_023322417.1 rho GTPase-activating protein 19 isoform X2 [Eurytemora carolleeae]XP_023322418.1 rho GTPase-activating protein 19 isoform X2 [Eurytemora carolleeae]XP_023322419.1 rho GTPase-activating protein 19 isoform X2 [Eurytemora carolleeae]XP_023322420.1 rho GTPase-activating protein 19 isoform X2 [Eurytemora carolleeae]XP_023322421.1 rho GTPase-activating protein 19 isoform X2 [Eurytemora carolleeae]|eukprot:XP_023322416.1 rho GTPase-activating protein 19-like isoform X2 [Eurytemora affinis]
MCGNMSGLDLALHMKMTEPEYYHSMVKMHLSFLLDLHTDECDCSFLYEKQEKESTLLKAFTPMKKKSTKGVMDGIPLTQEGVCQVYQIIEYLGRSHNITSEGLFRKHGNLKKQQALKERLNKGVPLNLDEDEFSVHECAGVLKNFLANLPEPLLTDAYYRAHCQIPLLCRETMSEEDRQAGFDRQISSLQLLFQLIPEVNYTLLKDLLTFLHAVSLRQDSNKMNAGNLGTVFSTHILCPRKLAPESLQSNHQLFSRAVTFMIENAERLFTIPEQLILDVENYLKKKNSVFQTPKAKTRRNPVTATPKVESPVVNTVFSFVDREASKPTANATDQALAALYAHVQSMPASAQKRKLVTKLNQANGKGTPEVSTSGSVRTVGRRQRKSGDGLINLLTPRRKRPATGSYTFRQPETKLEQQHSFRRQTSLQTPQISEREKVLSPSRSSPGLLISGRTSPDPPDVRGRTVLSPGLLSPRPRLASPQETPVSQVSDVCAVDEVDTPGKYSQEDLDESLPSCTGEHDGSFIVPPLPPRTPAPAVESPITRASTRLSSKQLEEAMTPRSRAPVLVCSTSQLDRWDALISRSPCLPENYNEDEPETDTSTDQESDRYFASLECESEGDELEVGFKGGKSGCRTRSLSSDFKQYLANQGLQVPSDTSSLEDSVLTDSEFNQSYSSDVRRLLQEGEKLSTSMQAVLDGSNPDLLDDNEPVNKSPRLSLSRPISSSSPTPGCSPSYSRTSSTSTIKAVDQSIQESGEVDENIDPNLRVPKRGRKRRSLTELGAKNPLGANNQDIQVVNGRNNV